MNKKLIMRGALVSLCCLSLQAWGAAEGEYASRDGVTRLIHRVNTQWQRTHADPGNAFWDNAAYHTGNMEAFFLTRDTAFLDYSLRWAERNQWKGAKSDDKKRWRLDYGETDDHVLFGDWQVCFQTYADLYNLSPHPRKIARAREVMEHQMGTPRRDYWWWADGLYMVMPVMTKMYGITGETRYLNKLDEYLTYADSLMYDADASLYYRDARYVYPAHHTASGKKDFWARGVSWVFAGFARVLKELPPTAPHREKYVARYRQLAKAIAACQQPEGYWTRSLLDADFAPGPETSGTAFFTYAFLWGINNGLLEADTYLPVVRRSWQYLTRTALQADGSIGYVQPIGDRAIPGQKVDARSTTNFGTGAFLLASCEMARFLALHPEGIDRPVATGADDRAYWCDLLYRMAAPVLSNMSRGELRKEMQVEVSPTWDGRDKGVTYMECFGRLMDGLAPWLTLPDDDTPEGRQRRQLREWALKSYAQAVDPNSPDYLLWRKEGQPLVDAAYIASSFLRAPKQLWQPLDTLTKRRYIEEFKQLRRIDPPYTNWLLFSATIESFLLSIDAQPDLFRIHTAVRKCEEWYVGDGWYSDGQEFAFDYYNSYVIHPMFLQVLETVARKKVILHDRSMEGELRTLAQARKRTQRFGMILERFVSPEGSFPTFGRSMTYRLGVFQPLAWLAWQECLPEELPGGQVRAVLTASMRRMFGNEGNFNAKGFLQLGFAGHQPTLGDWYSNNGSMYISSEAFLPLGLPASHPFWSDPAKPWTQKKAWGGDEFPKDHAYRE